MKWAALPGHLADWEKWGGVAVWGRRGMLRGARAELGGGATDKTASASRALSRLGNRGGCWRLGTPGAVEGREGGDGGGATNKTASASRALSPLGKRG